MALRSTASTRLATAIDRIALALLLGLFAFNLYRAATISISPDEALTFDRWVRPPLRDILPQPFDPHNHVLNTLLIKRSVGLFRLSEFSFRLPSVLAGGFYLWAVYRLARRLIGTGWLCLAGIAVTVLNPAILDFLSSARGYGIALAFWMWALDLLVNYLQSDQPTSMRNLNLAGICLGLSAAANVALLWQAAALATAFLLAAAWSGRLRPVVVMERLVIPAMATGFILLAIPLSHGHAGHFTDGAAPWWLWLVPPASLATAAMVGRIDLKALTIASMAIAILIAGYSISRFHVSYYSRWRKEAGAKALVRILRNDSAGRSVEIGSSPEIEPILSFYQARYRLSNWAPLRHRPVDGDFDYYVLNEQDTGLVAERRLDVLYRDPGLILARRVP
ncbi:MAG TPA: glycosyltransferase family 39 protein [Bryobacteraceae bacterium]